MSGEPPSRRSLFEDVLTGRRRLGSVLSRTEPEHSDKSSPESLEDMRSNESDRQGRLRRIFSSLTPGRKDEGAVSRFSGDDEQTRDAARQEYAAELWALCGGESRSGGPTFERFQSYVNAKERELYRIFHACDTDNDAYLTKEDLRRALDRSGTKVSKQTLDEFFALVDENDDGKISFREWRDVFLLLPRQTSLQEIFRFYAISKAPRHSATQITSEGDSVLLEPERKAKATFPGHQSSAEPHNEKQNRHREGYDEGDEADDDDEEDDTSIGIFTGAGRSFLAGGIAGAVSRTATAPFDRLKIYLINATPDVSKGTQSTVRGLAVLKAAVQALYREGGLRAGFVGNGLNVIKIFPESAIKYASYETSKRVFAKYWDHVDDPGDISDGSRFVAGGIGGITSQLAIYNIESVKNRCMSSTSAGPDALKGNALIMATAKKMWAEGGIKPFYRGLSLGLIGVFPMSGAYPLPFLLQVYVEKATAIDMSLYEAFRKAFLSYTNRDDPGPLWSMIFGAISGGLGAASVYPLNLVRTRLQTQGTPAHRRTYRGGAREVLKLTYQQEGYKGFFKGLTPTLLKVAPSVGISWAVFEAARSALVKAEKAAVAGT